MSRRKVPAIAADTTPSDLLAAACDRVRRRCVHQTEHSHANLTNWLKAALPAAWRVISPDDCPGCMERAPSQFPTDEAAGAARHLAAYLHTTEADAADILCGHCETCAVTFSETLIRLMEAEPVPAVSMEAITNHLDAAYTSLHASLVAASPTAQAERLFAVERRARGIAPGAALAEVLPVAASARQSAAMWAPLLSDDAAASVQPVNPTGRASLLDAWTAGLPPTAAHVTAAATRAQDTASVLARPLYVINYLWDGDELTVAELTAADAAETAQYSVHVVGLVFDGRRNVLYVADANGSLLPGGNTEFLTLPFTPLPAGAKPTTAVSRWDRDRRGPKKAKKM